MKLAKRISRIGNNDAKSNNRDSEKEYTILKNNHKKLTIPVGEIEYFIRDVIVPPLQLKKQNIEEKRKNSHFVNNLSMKTIFLSHSSRDREFVNRLARDLQTGGFNVWYDQWRLNVGDSLLEKIQEGIEKASWLVVVLSPHSVKSRWVKEELNLGLARQLAENSVFVLPVLYMDCQIPPFLREKVYADFRNNYNDGLKRLLETLRRRYTEQVQKRQFFPDTYAHDPLDFSPGSLLDSHRNEAKGRFRPELLDKLPGLWRGSTGRMQLEIEKNRIIGRYDWQGYGFSGSLRGEMVSEAIIFDWYWEISEEKGGGLFYTLVPDLLIGGWWMDYDYIDPGELLKNYEIPPNRWNFRKFR